MWHPVVICNLKRWASACYVPKWSNWWARHIAPNFTALGLNRHHIRRRRWKAESFLMWECLDGGVACGDHFLMKCMHTHTHTYIHTYIHYTYIHTYIHTTYNTYLPTYTHRYSTCIDVSSVSLERSTNKCINMFWTPKPAPARFTWLPSFPTALSMWFNVYLAQDKWLESIMARTMSSSSHPPSKLDTRRVQTYNVRLALLKLFESTINM